MFGFKNESNQEEIEITNLMATVQRVDVARHYLGKSQGTPHKGGVTFDLLSRDYVPTETTDK